MPPASQGTGRSSRFRFHVSLLILLAVAACGPAPGLGSSSGSGAPPAKPSRVTIGIWSEIKVLAPKVSEGGGGTFQNDFGFLINSPLVVFDPQGSLHPRLAADIPAQDKGTWVVAPDGRMATTWKIRPQALWHDGRPVTGQDFAFALRVYQDPDIVRPGSDPERYIDRVEVLDDKTFVIHWNQLYLRADRLTSRQLDALPTHLLEPLYAAQGAAFQGDPFWTSEAYVGNGPYRLVQWDKGSRLVYRAFDQYFLGRPKLDEVVMLITPDANTIVAYLLTGTVDLTVDTTLNQEMRVVVQKEWDRSGDGRIFSTPTYMRAAEFQFLAERLRQPAFLDARVRRALVYALDREAIAEVVSAGSSPVAHMMMHPSDPRYPQVEQAITRYGYDARRALDMMASAGWSRSPSGDLVNASGERFSFEIWTTQMADNVTELSLMASYYRAIGISVGEVPIPQAQNRERGFRDSFPGLTLTGHAIDVPWAMDRTTEKCPLPPAFSGGNRGCWSNQEYDSFFRIATSALDRNQQMDAIVQLFRVTTEDVPFFGTSYHMDNTPVRKGLVGPGPRWSTQNGNTWNIHEWYWE